MDLLRFFKRKKSQATQPVRIAIDADGLRVLRHGDEADAERSLRWKDVTLVAAYRKDCYGFDLCCVELLFKSGGSLVLQEQDEGFVDACFAITGNLAVSDPDWFMALEARPAFDTSIAIIFQRRDSH